MFSARVPRSLAPNRITRALHRTRAGGRTLVDLTLTNPTAAGFEYADTTLQALGGPGALRYDPHPLGHTEARRAVACDYARRGIHVDPRHIVLTASTSEAYSLLFKLLCEPHGEAVMVPAPSYPLFDHLTALDGVQAIPYPLEYHGRWVVDVGELQRRWTPSVRGVLAVSPNNPTGSVLAPEERRALAAFCGERRLALIIDEVFADYALSPESGALPSDGHRDVARAAGALTFRLGGLSKSAGLPQVKLGWILLEGPDALLLEALDRLEVICDAYLSVSTPVQIAAPALIEAGAALRRQILTRLRRNYQSLLSAAARHPAVEVLHADAGWSSVLRVPSTRSEEDLVVELLDRDAVLVHPGFFFDFAHEAFVVVSLLVAPDAFDAGVERVLERADG
jgi:hypothetical protein